MSTEQDSELRAEFVVESTELLEKLSEQLVDLEKQPDDRDLLNAIFRGFHTVKGGAGFFGLDSIVELCHAAEDVFNALRAGRRTLNPSIMDVILRASDDLRVMMEAVASEQAVPDADAEAVETLRAFADGLDQMAAPAAPAAAAPAAPAAPAVSSTTITAVADPFDEGEFDKLLDQLHGQGAVPGQAAAPAAPAPDAGKTKGGKDKSSKDKAGKDKPAVTKVADPFAEDEFDKLLDQLHGAGAVPGAPRPEEDEPPHKPAVAETPAHAPAHTPTPAAVPAAPAAASMPVHTADHAAVHATPTPIETSVRVDTERLDHVMNLIGELVLVRNRLKNFGSGPGMEVLRKTFSELDVITCGLQASIMQMRMQPIRKLFSRFPRMVRETARKLEKQVEVETIGEETELDKSLVEALNDPLMHMVRNAVDHGIEMPEVRTKSGKAAGGRLTLSAQQAGDSILITVRDDGAGMDAERLRRKVVEKGLMDASMAANLSQEECYQLIFMPGFSTKEQVSDLSGRGVGMDVVRSNISALNGVVQIESVLGRGSAFHIRVPLTLAIQPVLMVSLGGMRGESRLFAIPLQPVQDVFFLDPARIRRLDRWEAVLYRNETLRLVHLGRWAGMDRDEEDGAAHVVVVRVAGERFGLVVGRVRGREEIVVKPLGKMLRGLAGLGGATVTGAGRVALILDLDGLVTAYERSL